MDDGTMERLADSAPTKNAAGSPAMRNDNETSSSSELQPAIRYASNAEVDVAMEKIFQKHDQLFEELAK